MDAWRFARVDAARHRVVGCARLGERARCRRGVGRLGARPCALVAGMGTGGAWAVSGGGCVNARSSTLPVTYIRPGSRAMAFTLNEVWQARELLYFLVWRDVKVR